MLADLSLDHLVGTQAPVRRVGAAQSDTREHAISPLDLLADAYCDTYSHMKTTVEIPDTILEEARKIAARQETTLRVLIIEGLRRIIAERKRPGEFRLRKATFHGKGLRPEVAGAPWERIREMAY